MSTHILVLLLLPLLFLKRGVDAISLEFSIEKLGSCNEQQYKEDLYRDQAHDHIGNFNIIIGILSSLLIISILINFYLIQKKRKKKSKVNYKVVLSPQEQKVFELMNENITNKEIADKLFISLSTVKTHINNIYSKLSISSRKEITHFF